MWNFSAEVFMRLFAFAPILLLFSAGSIGGTAQEPSAWLTHGEWVMAILTLIYVLLTGFYAWTSHKTLKAIEKQAEMGAREATARDEQFGKQLKVARDTADAALLNVKAVITSERPWIVIVAKENSSGNFTFKARNHGRTPAEIISFSSEITFLDDIRSLPIPPKYNYDYLTDLPILVPTAADSSEDNELGLLWYDAELYLSTMEKEKIDAINQRKLVYIFYFRVVYRNTLRQSGIEETPYETRRCFWYSPKAAGGARTDGGPRAYNLST